MKAKLLSLILLLFAASAAAQVTYDIDNGLEEATMSVDVTLDCSTINCPRLTWGMPSGFDLVSVTGPDGESLDYKVSGGQVEIDTGRSGGRDEKTITIQFKSTEEAREIYSGLYKRELSLSAFEGDTSGIVDSENLISGNVGYGFQTSYAKRQYNFTGRGPVNIDINFGEGEKTDYYVLFGSYEGSKSLSGVYEIVAGTTGRVQNYERIPVAVIPGSVYNQTQSSWSSGEYGGGTIRIRGDLEDDFNKTLAHETVHAVNDEILDWDRTSSSYIDEGTAKYVDYLVDRQSVPVNQRDQRIRRLFGEEVSYTTTIDGQRYKITKPSRGDREVLWNYYEQDADFMKTWKPSDAEYRDFGYAYSELIIRHNILEKDMELSEMYDYFQMDQKISDPEVKWADLSENLDLTPCKTDNRTEFDNCLEEVNDHSQFTTYTAEPERGSTSLKIEKKQPPEEGDIEDVNGTLLGNETEVEELGSRQSFASFVTDLVRYILDGISNFVNSNVE